MATQEQLLGAILSAMTGTTGHGGTAEQSLSGILAEVQSDGNMPAANLLAQVDANGVIIDSNITKKRGVVNTNVFFSDLFSSHLAVSTINATGTNTGPNWNVTIGTSGNGETAPNIGPGYVSFPDALWNSTIATSTAIYLNATHAVVPRRWGNEIAFFKSTGVVGGSNTIILQPTASISNMIHCSLSSSGMKIEITTVGGGPGSFITLGTQALSVPTNGTHWVFEVEMSQTTVANDTITIRAGAPGTTLTSLTATDSRIAALFAAGTMKTTTYEVYANSLPATEKIRIYSTWAASDASPTNSIDLLDTPHTNAISGLMDAVSLAGYVPTTLAKLLLNVATADELAGLAGQTFAAKTNTDNQFANATTQKIITNGGGSDTDGIWLTKPDAGTNQKNMRLAGGFGFKVQQLTDLGVRSYDFINFDQPGYTGSNFVMARTWDGTRMVWSPILQTAVQGVTTYGTYFIGQPAAVTALTDAATIAQPDSNSNVMKVQLAAGAARTMGAPHAGFGGEGYTIKFFVKQPATGGAATVSFLVGNGYKTTGVVVAQSTGNSMTDYYEFQRLASGNFCLIRFVANIE